MDEHSGQGIFVRYEKKNESTIYNPCIRTIDLNENVKIDEKRLYDKSSVSLWEQADDDWCPSDNFSFADPNKFDEDINQSIPKNTSGPVFAIKEIAC